MSFSSYKIIHMAFCLHMCLAVYAHTHEQTYLRTYMPKFTFKNVMKISYLPCILNVYYIAPIIGYSIMTSFLLQLFIIYKRK